MFMKNLKSYYYTIISILVTINISFSQNIKSGPMLGYSEMKEVLIWIQTTSETKVKIKYWVKSNPDKSFFTDEIITQKQNAFVAKLIADKVLPSQKYDYQVFINGKLEKFDYPLNFQSKVLWEHRMDAPDLKFALGSCAFINETEVDRPGEPYGGEYDIYTSIFQKKPDFMIWGGDNVYLREVDWDTQTGIYHRYTHSRSLKELQPLLASTHNYAIWDDHDFGPNDSDKSFYNKQKTTDAFKLFWGNNTYGVAGLEGTTSQFKWNDCEFFMLDDRFYRTSARRKGIKSTILGEKQIDWLIDALLYSNAAFKFVVVGSQFLSSSASKENFNNYSDREVILKQLADERIPGVIFISGDRHFTEVSKMERQGSYPLYDFTISPLGSKPFKNADKEVNFYRIPESLLTERNFGTIEVSGSKQERQLKLTTFNVKGEEKFIIVIKSKDLKY